MHERTAMKQVPHRAFCTSSLGSATGYSLLECLCVISVSLTLGAMVIPQLLGAADDLRAAAAVRYLSTRLQQTRMDAVSRSINVGWQFVSTTTGYTYAPYRDGNGNGLRSQDIQGGVDLRLGPIERLTDYFAGVDFGAIAGLPAVEPDGFAPGTDPISLGSSKILTFTPLGTSSSGSIYVRGRHNAQYVLRILGETGKVRLLKFDPRARQWKPA
jgi:type II secretory pathway pseudopilin PulG